MFPVDQSLPQNCHQSSCVSQNTYVQSFAIFELIQFMLLNVWNVVNQFEKWAGEKKDGSKLILLGHTIRKCWQATICGVTDICTYPISVISRLEYCRSIREVVRVEA
jgi:hypothetical protein